MARYWNPAGSPANWGDTSSWAASDGGATGETVPTSSDDVFFTSTNVNNCVVNTTANCLSLDFTGETGYTGTFSGTSALNIYGSLAMSAGMSRTYTGTITFAATSTGKTITSAGKQFNSVNMFFNGVGGGWTLQDALYNGGSITHTAGDLDTNDKAVTVVSSFLESGTSARTLDLGSSAISCAYWIYDGSNLNFVAGTSTITVTNNTFTGGGLTYYTVVINGASCTIGGSNTFTTLTRTGTAVKTCLLGLTANNTVTGTFTLAGNSPINRILIYSSVNGVTRTITAATVVVSNADFQDIAGAGAGNWDLSAITGLSGNCGGNSGITFTEPTTQDCSAGTTWSTATWTNHVPLVQDTATFSGAGRTITQDMPRIGSVNFTGSSGLTWTTSTSCTCFGSINLTNLGTLTASTNTYTFAGRSNYTLTSAGKSWAKQIAINAAGGKLTIQDAFVTSDVVQLYAGELDTNGQTMQSSSFASSTGTKTLTLGNTIWTLTLATGAILSINATGMTMTANTGTFKFTGALTGDITLSGASFNFNGASIWNATTNAFSLKVTGSNTFNDIKLDAGRTIKFTAGTTTTLTSLDATGAGTTITSVTSAAHTLSCASGTIQVSGCTISYSHAEGGATWDAYTLADNVDGGNNTGWLFTGPGSVTQFSTQKIGQGSKHLKNPW